MLTHTVEIVAEDGLDVKATTILVNQASEFKSSIKFIVDGREADAKSIINLMALNIQHRQTLEIQVDGNDAKAAMECVLQTLKECKVIA